MSDYRDPKVLRILYHGEGMTQTEMTEELGCSTSVISYWMGKHGIETRSQSEAAVVGHGTEDSPWHDEDLLERMYVQESMSTREVGEELGCDQAHIVRQLRKYGIDTRKQPSERHLSMRMDQGYERFESNWDGRHETVLHHRLLAVSEFGFEEVRNKVIHHKNGIPWDNRPENIEPMTNSDHVSYHRSEVNYSGEAAV